MIDPQKPATMKPKAKLGDEAWEVEWCDNLPLNGAGEGLLDKAHYVRRYAGTLREAMQAAKKVYPQDQFGAVRITLVRWIDPHADTEDAGRSSQFRWEPIADPIEYSGEAAK